ncbi:MAG: hypothetical protein H6Q73_4251 [Firmicutes bacterium]|nr:hypothetical protein [Bacillota bacterium]
MIISASRRTDIPAFYSEWFINRLKAGYVYVRNPLNCRQISNIQLNTAVVDCIVFWTKNAAPMLDKLEIIDELGYRYYFQWTLTPYGKTVEYNLPDKSAVIESFKTLSNKIGRQRIIWRYDPVIVSRQFPVEYHIAMFSKLCHELTGYTNKCIFSYVDLYPKIKNRVAGIGASEVDTKTMLEIAAGFSVIAKQCDILLETCCEQIELSQFGIAHAACINKPTVEAIIGYPINEKKAQGQREYCNCIESADIGAYDCCAHGCIYCYGTATAKAVQENIKRHDVNSPLLTGWPCENDKITKRVSKTLKNSQLRLL